MEKNTLLFGFLLVFIGFSKPALAQKCIDYLKYSAKIEKKDVGDCKCIKRKKVPSAAFRRRITPFCETVKVIAIKFDTTKRLIINKLDSITLVSLQSISTELTPRQIDELTYHLFSTYALYGSPGFECVMDFSGTGYFFVPRFGYVCLDKNNQIIDYCLYAIDNNTHTKEYSIMQCNNKYKLLKKIFDKLP